MYTYKYIFIYIYIYIYTGRIHPIPEEAGERYRYGVSTVVDELLAGPNSNFTYLYIYIYIYIYI